MRTHMIAVLAAALIAAFSGGLRAAEDEQFSNERMELLEQMLKQQQSRIVQLESGQQDDWLSEQRQDQVRELIRETLADVDTRAQLMGDVLTAGYDEGFFIRSADDEYLFKINTLLQFRYTGISRGDNDRAFGTGSFHSTDFRNGPRFVPEDTDRSDFELERARLRFSGHIPSGLNDNSIEYYIQLGLGSDHSPSNLLADKYPLEEGTGLDSAGSIGDEDERGLLEHLHQQMQDDQSSGVHLLDWYVQWEYAEWLTLRAGQYKMPFGRQELVAPEHQMLVDRSLANEMFNVGRSIGIGALGDFQMLDQNFSYEVMVANGFHQENRTEVAREIDSIFAYAARLVWYANGSTADDFVDESAYGYETGKYDEMKLSAGLSFAYMDNNNRRGIFPPIYFASFGDDDLENAIIDETDDMAGDGGSANMATIPLTQAFIGEPFYTEVTQFAADVALKQKALAISAEWFVRVIDFDKDLFLNYRYYNADTIHQQGAYVQAGYFFTPKLEAVARLGGVWDNANDNVWEYAAGVNYYIRGHDVKLSLDYTGTHEATVNSNDAGFGLNEEAGMWRGQLQVLF